MSLPTTLEFGYVTGTFVQPISTDGQASIPAAGDVTFTPVGYRLIGGATPATVTIDSVVAAIDSATGEITSTDGTPGVWLVAGWYDVTCKFSASLRAKFTIEVTGAHTQVDPLDLTLSAPLVPDPSTQFVVNEQVYLDTLAARDEAEAFAQGLHATTHYTGGTDPLAPANIGAAAASHQHDAADVNAGTLNIARIPTGQTGTTVPLGDDARFTDARTPTAHAASHAQGGSDALDVADLSSGAATSGQVPKSDGAGGVAWLDESAGGHIIEDEGAPLAARAALNFIGAAVTVTDNAAGDSTDVTISVDSGGHTIENAGTPMTARSALNFTGVGVTDNAASDSTDVTVYPNVHVVHWSTALNDYPAQPASLPGCAMRWAIGPVEPTYDAIPGVFDHYSWADGANLP